MKIGKLSDLMSAIQSGVGNSTTNRASANTPESIAQNVPQDAAKVSSNFGSGDESDSSRAARVANLKSQVDQGSYNPDSRAVAEKVAADLFA